MVILSDVNFFWDSFRAKSKRLPKDKIGIFGFLHSLANFFICRLSLYIPYLWDHIFVGRNDHQRTCGSSSLRALSWTRGTLAGRAFRPFTCYDRIRAFISLPRLTNCLLLPRHFVELDLLCFSYAGTGEQSIGHMIFTNLLLCFSQASFTFPTNELPIYLFPPRLACSCSLQFCSLLFSRLQFQTDIYSGARPYLEPRLQIWFPGLCHNPCRNPRSQPALCWKFIHIVPESG